MPASVQPHNALRQKVGTGLIVFIGVVLCGSAIAKLAHVPKVVTQLGAMGFAGDRLTLIAVLELLSAGLFLFRGTRALGLLLISAFLGGAVAAHVQHGELPLQPAFVLGLVWLAAWLWHPGILRPSHEGSENVISLAAHETVVERP